MRHDITKIVATLGPASSTPEAIRALLEAGVNVCRINFSHGTHAQHAQTIAHVRAAATALGLPVAILGDLQGPRIRIGVLPEPFEVTAGQALTFVPEAHATGEDVPVTYDDIARDVQVGATILVNDGLLAFEVQRIEGDRVHVIVTVGGRLTSNKGMNLPGVDVSAPSLTEKDRADVVFAVEQDLDYLALSFVRRADDLRLLRSLVPAGMLLVAKIEKDSALERIEEILQATDAVMVARGDLGSEMGLEAVPRLQRRILSAAQACGRPTIVATEVLASMQRHAQPSRAEVGDLARAVLDDADAIMLSGETAVGRHPALVVSTAATVLARAEQWRAEDARASPTPQSAGRATAALAHAAWHLARDLRAVMVLVDARDREIVRELGQNGLAVPIVPVGDEPEEIRALLLHRGVLPLVIPRGIDREAAVDLARRMARDRFGLAAGEGPTVVVGRLVHGGVRPVPPLRGDRR